VISQIAIRIVNTFIVSLYTDRYVMTSTYALVFSIKILHHQIYVMLDWENAFQENVVNLVVMQNVLQSLNKVLGFVFQALVQEVDVFVPIEVENSYINQIIIMKLIYLSNEFNIYILFIFQIYNILCYCFYLSNYY
jgi:hypothetical protein